MSISFLYRLYNEMQKQKLYEAKEALKIDIGKIEEYYIDIRIFRFKYCFNNYHVLNIYY